MPLVDIETFIEKDSEDLTPLPWSGNFSLSLFDYKLPKDETLSNNLKHIVKILVQSMKIVVFCIPVIYLLSYFVLSFASEQIHRQINGESRADFPSNPSIVVLHKIENRTAFNLVFQIIFRQIGILIAIGVFSFPFLFLDLKNIKKCRKVTFWFILIEIVLGISELMLYYTGLISEPIIFVILTFSVILIQFLYFKNYLHPLLEISNRFSYYALKNVTILFFILVIGVFYALLVVEIMLKAHNDIFRIVYRLIFHTFLFEIIGALCRFASLLHSIHSPYKKFHFIYFPMQIIVALLGRFLALGMSTFWGRIIMAALIGLEDTRLRISMPQRDKLWIQLFQTISKCQSRSAVSESNVKNSSQELQEHQEQRIPRDSETVLQGSLNCIESSSETGKPSRIISSVESVESLNRELSRPVLKTDSNSSFSPLNESIESSIHESGTPFDLKLQVEPPAANSPPLDQSNIKETQPSPSQTIKPQSNLSSQQEIQNNFTFEELLTSSSPQIENEPSELSPSNSPSIEPWNFQINLGNNNKLYGLWYCYDEIAEILAVLITPFYFAFLHFVPVKGEQMISVTELILMTIFSLVFETSADMLRIFFYDRLGSKLLPLLLKQKKRVLSPKESNILYWARFNQYIRYCWSEYHSHNSSRTILVFEIIFAFLAICYIQSSFLYRFSCAELQSNGSIITYFC